ncbi:unnamed protein product [Caenorhabditis sp. 36 PRJEB53466]|nr:unnamed protein product [Caenorhabditis sp. 36 PRJEB53466]
MASNCSSPIQIRCPLCPNEHSIASPEELVGHMAQSHEVHSTMQSKCFDSFAHFQIWLSNIEDSRCDGGYLGSSQGPSYEDEYYLLCRRRPSATTKRRRMSEVSANSEASSLVTCTAFVHVFETMDGRVTVRYCLDHCGHSVDGDEHKNTDTTKFRKRSTLKRSSPCATFELCDENCHCEQSSMASSPSSSVDFEDEDASNNNYKSSSDDSYTVSNLNVLITQRLDTTADRLRALTKVLQELAVDIRNTDYPMVI